jgi:protein-L-isoaspartate(D-aspartate) O-methyltransferase
VLPTPFPKVSVVAIIDFEKDRARLIEHLRSEIDDKRVLRAMEHIPREMFIPRSSHQEAYEDRPLPIGQGQTISQPYIVALMTAALELKGTEKVLEIGTGSGYQAAILAELARLVVTVERLENLAHHAKETLHQLGYQNIEVHVAGPSIGWPEEAPYDAIIVTAAAPVVPPELLEQMSVGGRMVIPVGSRFEQQLIKIIRQQTSYQYENLGGCRFVPLIGQGAWQENE